MWGRRNTVKKSWDGGYDINGAAKCIIHGENTLAGNRCYPRKFIGSDTKNNIMFFRIKLDKIRRPKEWKTDNFYIPSIIIRCDVAILIIFHETMIIFDWTWYYSFCTFARHDIAGVDTVRGASDDFVGFEGLGLFRGSHLRSVHHDIKYIMSKYCYYRQAFQKLFPRRTNSRSIAVPSSCCYNIDVPFILKYYYDIIQLALH